jgi:hypothetical protein
LVQGVLATGQFRGFIRDLRGTGGSLESSAVRGARCRDAGLDSSKYSSRCCDAAGRIIGTTPYPVNRFPLLAAQRRCSAEAIVSKYLFSPWKAGHRR